ncbi:ChaN family lipoprotein [Pseudohongiella spirulinae]|uniref:Haem-binding uptake Tiki superfamily ChaN domain-containing protein n=1 Tax=Pseudohongiella spirulinae TaxID=1249552 RepID=A0A0S2KG05_9GAMM|nr:ChaN family lipoprotein [Pseudohongiella spirulinae]ALO47245.1 hypothetical protein PS2015_2613 [Pseudohongiella spirulinae]
MRRSVVTSIFCLLLSATACHGQSESQQAWQSKHFTDHPLSGLIFETTTETFITPTMLLGSLSQNQLVLLGEKHDNPDHHRLRLSLLESLIHDGHISLLSFEMMDNSQQTALTGLQDSNAIHGEQQVIEALSWDEAWTWEFYRSPLLLAIQSGLELRAGNIDRQQVRNIYTQSDTSIQELDSEQLAALTREIDLSHCGMLPESQFPAMVRVQQARDRALAISLQNAPEQKAAALLAGNFHVRHDLGVSNYLPPNSGSVVNLAFLEVIPGLEQAGDYVPETGGRKAYDFIWFTPAVRTDDYCAELQSSSDN